MKAKTALLSIDYDFFIREDPLWDFGHSEGLNAGPLGGAIWFSRYMALDLFEETDPDTYADFQPIQIVEALRQKGFAFPEEKIPVGVGDSHRHALEYLTRLGQPDVLINIDAHHDCYEPRGEEVECDTWLTEMIDKWGVEVAQIYPGWKDQAWDPAPVRPMSIHAWPEWVPAKEGSPLVVQGIYVSRSGTWVPPHHDPGFLDMVDRIRSIGTVEVVEETPLRPHPHPRGVAEAHHRMRNLRHTPPPRR